MNTHNTSEDLTQLIRETAAGNKDAETRLMELAFCRLHRRARFYLARERPDHTLQPTALVNETYLRLAGQLDRDWKNREHFYAVAAQLMRHTLVDYARRHRAPKRGGDLRKISLDDEKGAAIQVEAQFETLIALDDAVDRLCKLDARAARVVELRFFQGLTVRETAEILGVSEDLVKDDWKFAQAWLLNELTVR